MSDSTRNFSTTLGEGKYGEDLIKSYLEANGYNVKDVSDDFIYREKDIDFLCSKDGKVFTLEVKTDNRIFETGNFPVELYMNRRTERKPGWFYYCRADVICFYDNIQGQVYFIDWDKLRERVVSELQTYDEILVGKHAPSRIFESFWNKKTFSNYIDECTGVLCLAPIKEAIEYTYEGLVALSNCRLR